MNQIFTYYDKFLTMFPDPWHPYVSIAILIAMAVIVFRFWKVEIVGIILLIIFVPASIPILRNLGQTLLQFANHIIGK
ncbi:MAG: hypothetical protein WC773_00190 [Patescibacteria group bacterium]|jgi:hypothetical protein